jgi:hypothetical protein
LVFPNDEGPWDPSWLEPLDLVTKAVAGNSRFRFFDPAELWELPWMKEGLEHEGRGLDFDDAWQRDPRRRNRAR